jgi:hypothetical protein
MRSNDELCGRAQSEEGEDPFDHAVASPAKIVIANFGYQSSKSRGQKIDDCLLLVTIIPEHRRSTDDRVRCMVPLSTQGQCRWFRVGILQIPSLFRKKLPPDPDYPGTWPPARHVRHVTEYERCLVMPSMSEWLDVPVAPEIDWPDDDNTWAKVQERGADELINENFI